MRRLTKAYTIEYSALLHSIIEISRQCKHMFHIQKLGPAEYQQRLVEGTYLVRILDKLIIEIETFLSDCVAIKL